MLVGITCIVPRLVWAWATPCSAASFHHFIKDMTIALKEAEAMGIDLPTLRTAKGLYQKVADAGAREDGTQALIKAYD